MAPTSTMPMVDCGALGSPRGVQEGKGMDSNGCSLPDYLFRCNYCIKLIADDSPVYMRHDCSFCSPLCRDRGISLLYMRLKDTQLSHKPPSGCSLSNSNRITSDSSICSKATRRHDDEFDGATTRLGPLYRLGHRVMDTLLQRVASRTWGNQALRTYSSGMLWGRELTQNSSVCGALFNYLPEVEHYLGQGERLQSRPLCYSRGENCCSSAEDLAYVAAPLEPVPMDCH